ncbi:MAG TPA: methyltransferase domain-containing protein [Woeseiaceae bacterium]|nr:methyltransferase domain-containing protein [Woeseiaceae bacterium]
MTDSFSDTQVFDVGSVRRRFDRAAARFDRADFVHRHTAAGLFERLDPMLLAPARILDVGAATGSASRELARRYRKSRVLSLDLSFKMLEAASARRSRFARVRELQADASRIPLLEGCIDMVFANMFLPWSGEPMRFLGEVRRVLRKEGLFAFSTLGPDSLRALRESWEAIDRGEHVNPFPDMHDVGDAVLRAGLRDPVLDVDYLKVTWPHSAALFADITAAGARNSLKRRRRTLTGKHRFARMREHLDGQCRQDGLTMEFEIVYGHAWGSGAAPPAGEYRLGVGDIGRRRR